jgi:quercetin dioxygenase-like cupin family protein
MEPAATETWQWADSLDALEAASEFHSLLFEDDSVRILATRIGPGATVPLHTHRWPSVLYTLATAHRVRRDGEGNVLTDTRGTDLAGEEGTALWTPAMPPHSVENVDNSEIRLLNVELKR